MSNMDIRSVFAILFISVMFICIGLIIKKFNLAEIVSGFNFKKHEKYKELISKYIGNLLFYSGLFSLISLVFNLIFKIINMSILSYIVFGIIVLSVLIMLVYINVKINKLDKRQEGNT